MNNNSQPHSDNHRQIEQSWQIAGERIFLYLRCLNFPVEQIFEISGAVLKEAQQNRIVGGNPIAYAMETLHKFIDGQSYQKNVSQNFPYYKCGHHAGSVGEYSSGNSHYVLSMPAICRLHMTPEDFGSD